MFWARRRRVCPYIKVYRVSEGLTEFAPNYPLWTDGAGKTRWIYLPPGDKIDTSDPDHWVFPVGTLFFKEFRKTIPSGLYTTKEIRIETRLLAKVKDVVGPDGWLTVTYEWQEDQRDAKLSAGYENVLGTNHDIPTQKQCVQCHQGNKDFILGFDAIQLSDARVSGNINAIEAQKPVWTLLKLQDAGRLTHPFEEEPVIPGTSLAKKALGYMHGNCGHCHNPRGEALLDIDAVKRGLVGRFNFSHEKAVPRVAIVYLPEDEGLDSQASGFGSLRRGQTRIFQRQRLIKYSLCSAAVGEC